MSLTDRYIHRWVGAIALVCGVLLSGCQGAPEKVSVGSKSNGVQSDNNQGEKIPDNKSPSGGLSLASCAAPVRNIYRLTRTEMANTIGAVLDLTPAETASLKASLTVEATKTGYENDLNSLQVTPEQLMSLSLALDTLLTNERIKTILNCGDKTDVADSCVSTALSEMVKKSYISTDASSPSLQAYKQMVANLKTKGYDRLRFAIRNIFISPSFLFHSTNKEDIKAHLANTIWLGTGEYAKNSELKGLRDRQFVKKLLSDEKAQRFAQSFLMRRMKIDDIAKNTDSSKAQQANLFESMGQESKLFIWDIFRSDRPLADLLLSKQSFVDSELAKIYGLPNPGPGFVKVNLPENRRGLLTQASVLTATSKATETKIISRGLWIVEKAFCQHIPAAPDVEALPPDNPAKPTTLREKLEIHRAAPACSGCHTLMDPPGFALENFGPLGAFRTQYENGLPVDTRANFKDGTVTQTPSEFFSYVEKRKGDFTNCLAEELLTYVTRRSLNEGDKCAVDTLARGMTENGWGLETSLSEILMWYEK
jgi:hypothetical protein